MMPMPMPTPVQCTKPHAALVASPGMGHLIPVIELGKRLVANHGFGVTIFVVTTNTLPLPSNILKESPSPTLLKIVPLPPVDISNLITPTTLTLTQLAMMMREALPSLRSELQAMTSPPCVLIVDLFGTEAMAIADELNMLKYVFITSSAWFLALTVHLPTLHDKIALDEHVKGQKPLLILGCKSLRFEDSLESILNRHDQIYVEYVRMGVEIPTADGILVNTWQDLEPSTLRALADKKMLGQATRVPVYPVGPLVRPVNSELSCDVLVWLGMQPSESVIYVSFGSGGTLSAKQTLELAWGLELSEQRFVWVARPPVENDASASLFGKGPRCDDGTPYFLPDGFLTRTHNMGMVVTEWAPQTEILAHPSVGGFLSHCGWNSTVEGLINGVPMIAWPLYAEQRMNAAMLTADIGVALRSKTMPPEELVGREEVGTMIRNIMLKEGNARRAKARKLKSSAEKAIHSGGTSHNSLSRMADECETRLRYLRSRIEGA